MLVATKNLPRSLKGITRKRNVNVSILRQDQTVSTFGSWWDGGSRNEFYFINLQTGGRKSAEYSSNPPEYGGEVKDLRPESGYALVKCGVFCGKEMKPTIYVLETDNLVGMWGF